MPGKAFYSNQKLEERLNSAPNRLQEFPSAVRGNRLKACVMAADPTLASYRWQVKHWTCLTKISNLGTLNSVENQRGVVRIRINQESWNYKEAGWYQTVALIPHLAFLCGSFRTTTKSFSTIKLHSKARMKKSQCGTSEAATVPKTCLFFSHVCIWILRHWNVTRRLHESLVWHTEIT